MFTQASCIGEGVYILYGSQDNGKTGERNNEKQVLIKGKKLKKSYGFSSFS